MIINDWTVFLRTLCEELLRDTEFPEVFVSKESFVAATKQQWFTLPPASEAELQAAERRLKTELPKSYRDFLLTTNGWGLLGYSTRRMRPVAEIGWLRDKDPKFIEAWLSGVGEDGPRYFPDETYLTYGKEQDVCAIRDEYFYDCLQISDEYNGAFLLLNPVIRDENGEWEAWEFATWYPGAIRYRSFYDLMQAQLDRARKYAAEAT